ncbi:MAG: hypothetical protein HeimC2_42770 [Candidatus Heimdallarchaeota archaeon LC_2]|nr:MAG: hypothetical protein HeimC2_42770 [Candidatus Heimdallarchaeota archaeon LC_2]
MKSITYRPFDDRDSYPYFYGVTLKVGDKYYQPDYDIDYEEFNKTILTEKKWGIWELHKIAVQTDDERILVEIVLNSDRLLSPQGDEDFDYNAPGEAAASKITSLENVKKIIDLYLSEVYNWESYIITQDTYQHLVHYLDDDARYHYFKKILKLYPRSDMEKRNYKSENCEKELLYHINDKEILHKILLDEKYHEFHNMVRKGLHID